MKTRLFISLAMIILLTGTAFALNRNRKIEPVVDAHAVLTKSLYDETLQMDPTSRRLVYVSYISGFVDAMQLNSIDNGVAKKFLEDCRGLTMGDLIDMSINFKSENAQWRDVSPAMIFTVAIPRLKKGLSPFPESADPSAK
jgi:hypothetical protein